MAPREGKDAACTKARSLIEDHLDDNLTGASTTELSAHIERCESCRRELELAEAIHRELTGLPHFDLPARALDRVRQRIDRRRIPVRARERFGRRPTWAALAAAAAAMLAVTLALLVPDRSDDRAAVTDPEVARATVEARLAFALIADATERAEQELRAKVLRERVLATAFRGVSRSFRLRSKTSPSHNVQPTSGPESGGST
jgi:anti-sigma factor RsiW